MKTWMVQKPKDYVYLPVYVATKWKIGGLAFGDMPVAMSCLYLF